MFNRIYNLVFIIIFALHVLGIISIPNEIRYLMIAFYLILLIYSLLNKKTNTKLNGDDDIFVMTTNPNKPSPSDPNMEKFMNDLNQSIEKKKLDKIKVKNE
ncbi:hypothetical protein [Neisseria mucosa]|uniref:hypothetical protein n=1 Tax=Neisseria mucosa TaxID=488 RepID=UPI00051E123C|nr:hypothetical protein [Neisseria mucosa]KGJ29516.1 hypothetical protein ES17_10390 [Neisseria mucosa]